MTFGHAERRKERDNQLDNAAWEANASSSSSSSRFRLVPTKSVKPSTDLEQPEGLFPKMGACGQRSKIDRSLELDDLKNHCRHQRQCNDASAWLLLRQALVESRVALPARLGQEVYVDLFFLRRLDEQTARRCARFWQYRRCNATSCGWFFARNDPDALVASLRPSPNVTHGLACKISAGTGPKPTKKGIWWSTDPIYHTIVLVSSCSLVLMCLHLSQALKTKEWREFDKILTQSFLFLA